MLARFEGQTPRLLLLHHNKIPGKLFFPRVAILYRLLFIMLGHLISAACLRLTQSSNRQLEVAQIGAFVRVAMVSSHVQRILTVERHHPTLSILHVNVRGKARGV
jgi:hypothetical protein